MNLKQKNLKSKRKRKQMIIRKMKKNYISWLLFYN